MDVIIKESKIHGKGVFANRDFKKGEIIFKWRPSQLPIKISEEDKKYTINIKGKTFLMNPPERYVNRSCNPNTNPDMENLYDIAIRKIKKGEEITTNYLLESNTNCNCGDINCKNKNLK